jgi:DNA-binding transcriptional LysR family regulator
MEMNIKKYEVFSRTAELGSLTRAAESLGLTQSAVSHIIAGLEEDFGFPLLVRSRLGARLTSDGERVMPLIRNILSDNEELEQTAEAIRGLDTGSVSIGTFTSVAVHWLPGMIKEFQLDYPRVEFKLSNGDYYDVDRWLSEGSVDIGFITLPTDLKCECVPLLKDRILAVLPPDRSLCGLERFPLKDMENEPFISLMEGSDNDVRRALDMVGISPDVKFTTKDDYAIIAMVEQGLGVSILPELLLEGRRNNVQVLELDPPVSRTIALAFPAAYSAGPATRRFAEYVSKWVKEHYGK